MGRQAINKENGGYEATVSHLRTTLLYSALGWWGTSSPLLRQPCVPVVGRMSLGECAHCTWAQASPAQPWRSREHPLTLTPPQLLHDFPEVRSREPEELMRERVSTEMEGAQLTGSPTGKGQVGAEGYALPSLAQLSSANRGRYRERRKKMPPKSLPAAWALNIPLELQGAVSSVAASELSLQFQRLETQLHHAPPQNISVNWRGCLFRDLNFR